MDKPHRCLIIKLGGSAITNKSEFETAHPHNIQAAAQLIQECTQAGYQVIAVHGAGSFGHHQAKEYSVRAGWRHLADAEKTKVKEGCVKTRISVLKLNQLVTEIFAESGLQVISQSPCASWMTDGGAVIQHSVTEIVQLLADGFIPLLHGDVVMDRTLGATILSGDTIIKVLCEHLKPARVVFLSDVQGIFNKPPSESDALLIPEISVQQDGRISTNISTSSLECDVTGGIQLKLRAATEIIRGSIGAVCVCVCQIGSVGACEACLHGKFTKGSGSIMTYKINVESSS